MKRDWDVIRDVLIEVEALGSTQFETISTVRPVKVTTFKRILMASFFGRVGS